ncbi:MAG: response regulator transcription factor [Bacteroidetes bacterium]|nr:response regulator transcription factor [Bacteroidota bacterium]MBS1932442.1 response regulator transcription factor [Bacteroidota bacterium]
MRILIADDHAVVRSGLSAVLQSSYPNAEIEEAADGETLIQKCAGNKFLLVITDISMPGHNGIEAIEKLCVAQPGLPVLVLSMHPENQYALRVMNAGAMGYVRKDATPEELLRAIDRILHGRKYISTAFAEKLAGQLSQSFGKIKIPHEHLSRRELQVMLQLAKGKSIQEIARELYIRSSTVSTYQARLMYKMGFERNIDLIRYVVDYGLAV